MSSGAEDSEPIDADRPTGVTALVPAAEPGTGRPQDPAHRHHHHHVLIEPEEDRWHWRRKIRQNPRQLAVYRVAVGIAGLILVALGFVTGPIPGPGGIPLVLLGLAIWSSEFEWAHRLMMWFKAQLHRFRQWSRPRQVLFWVAFFSCCGMVGYLYAVVIGVPRWMPNPVTVLLQRLPGV